MLEDPYKTKNDIVKWIQQYFSNNGPNASAVIGISGGKDSTIAAALCAEAIGKDRVVGVLMPDGIQHDIKFSYEVVKELGIRHAEINVHEAVAAITRRVILSGLCNGDMSNQAKYNLPPRIRMATLYAVAQNLPNGGRVVNTDNASESYVGYSTKYGDTAGDFSPLGSLWVSEVIQVGETLPISKELIKRAPADGLTGKTDEENFGFTYDMLEQFYYHGTSGDPKVDELIKEMHYKSLHKILPMPKFKVE